MYYDVEELSKAITTAKSIINNRTKTVDVFTRGYNDCWALAIEYDKALRNKEESPFNFEYKNSLDFFRKLNRAGYKSYDDLARAANYRVITSSRPRHGDIAFEFLVNGVGAFMIAENGYWVTTCELNSGIKETRKIKSKETLNLLARPVKDL